MSCRLSQPSKSSVALLYCDTYSKEIVYRKIKTGFDLLGGINQFFKTDERILIKPNFVRPAEAQRALTTHPSVILAAARILFEHGYTHLKAGDSCGFGSPIKAMEMLQLNEPFEKYGVEMAAFRAGEKTVIPGAVHAKEFIFAKDVLDADALLSLSKMKTHALEYISGAVKNQYGCVQGLHKAKGHTVYPSQESFAKMLIDLNMYIRPRFYILDGIVAMEGNGPVSGDPTPMNVILMGKDPVAIDSLFASLIHLPPANVPTNVFGRQMGLGTYLEEEIEIIGECGTLSLSEAVRRFGNPNFNVLRVTHSSRGFIKIIAGLNMFKRKPRIRRDICKKCGVCVDICPVEEKALSFRNGRGKAPVYDYKKCIRCFCCQEMCPHKAIYVKGKH